MATQASIDLAQQMYVAYYGRPADQEGLDFWAEAFDASTDLDAALTEFGTSAEFTASSGSLTNTQLVTNLFQQLFSRAPDAEGLAFYVDRLDTEFSTLAEIAKQIADGASGTDITALANKVTVANTFTAAVTASGAAYTEADIAEAQAILTAVTDDAATVTAGDAAADAYSVSNSALVATAAAAAYAEVVLSAEGSATAGVLATANALTLTTAEAAIAGGAIQADIDADLAVLVAAGAADLAAAVQVQTLANLEALDAANAAIVTYVAANTVDGDGVAADIGIAATAADAAEVAAEVLVGAEINGIATYVAADYTGGSDAIQAVIATEVQAANAVTLTALQATTTAAQVLVDAVTGLPAAITVEAAAQAADDAAALVVTAADLALNIAEAGYEVTNGAITIDAGTGLVAGLIVDGQALEAADGVVEILNTTAVAGTAVSVSTVQGTDVVAAVAQEIVKTLSAAIAVGETLTITINGTVYTAPFNTNAATTYGDLETSIEAGEPVGVAVAGDALTITANVAGTAYVIDVNLSSDGAQTVADSGSVANVVAVSNVDEVSTVTFTDLAPNQSVTAEGVTFTNTTSVTILAVDVAVAFEALGDGANFTVTDPAPADADLTFTATGDETDLVTSANAAITTAITETTNPGVTALLAAIQTRQDADAAKVLTASALTDAIAAVNALDGAHALANAVTTAQDAVDVQVDLDTDLADALAAEVVATDAATAANATEAALVVLETASTDAFDEFADADQLMDAAWGVNEAGTAGGDADIYLYDAIAIAALTNNTTTMGLNATEAQDTIFIGMGFTANAGDPATDGDDAVLEYFIEASGVDDADTTITFETSVFGSNAATPETNIIVLTGVVVADVTIADGFINVA